MVTLRERALVLTALELILCWFFAAVLVRGPVVAEWGTVMVTVVVVPDALPTPPVAE